MRLSPTLAMCSVCPSTIRANAIVEAIARLPSRRPDSATTAALAARTATVISRGTPVSWLLRKEARTVSTASWAARSPYSSPPTPSHTTATSNRRPARVTKCSTAQRSSLYFRPPGLLSLPKRTSAMLNHRRPPATRKMAGASGSRTPSAHVVGKVIFVGRWFVHDSGAVVGAAAVLKVAGLGHQVEAHLDPTTAQVPQHNLVAVGQQHRIVGREGPTVQPRPGAGTVVGELEGLAILLDGAMDPADRALYVAIEGDVGGLGVAADGGRRFDNVDRLTHQALRPFQDREGCQNLILQRPAGKEGMQRLGGHGAGSGRRGFPGAPSEEVNASAQCNHHHNGHAYQAQDGKRAERDDRRPYGRRRVFDDDGCLCGGLETERVLEPDFQRHRVRPDGGDLRKIGLELRLRGVRRRGGGRLGDAVDEQFRRTEAPRVAVREGDTRHDLDLGWAVDGRAVRIEGGLARDDGAGGGFLQGHGR